jgi:hypothetical protein
MFRYLVHEEGHRARAKAFHRLLTCSEFHGLRFCGIVDEPTLLS